MRLPPLAGHLRGELLGPPGLLLGARAGPLCGGDTLGDLAHLVAVFLLQYLHERRPADQGGRAARGQHLQRGGQPADHVR